MSSKTTMLDIIKYVLPGGSAGDAKGWTSVCEWPPDLFAVVATITDRSGLYSESVFIDYWTSDFVPTKAWIKTARKVGEEWARHGIPPAEVQDLWNDLVRKNGKAQIHDSSEAAIRWKVIVFRLLTIADEACAGIGFPPDRSGNAIQYTYYKDYIAWCAKGPTATGGETLPYIPYSLCVRVPPAVVCVQPKTNTPGVGCTLRSLTLHLALLPSISNVSTRWHIMPHDSFDAFNVLVVPFPFLIPGKSFKSLPGCFPGNPNERAFNISPEVWLRDVSPKDFAEEFIVGLLKAANAELEPIHAVVFPETALQEDFANELAKVLAANTSLELLVTGVMVSRQGQVRNSAAIYQFDDGQVILSSFQSKHHRWCLNGDQVRRYQLGHVLDPHFKWWEQIDVSYRQCYVTLFRPGATLSVLICEDLARYDPVLSVMNAIGPNLVIALLLDGPQLEQRWPGRYATALAEDPGSAVLTVTSLGMVTRSGMPGEAQNREIALWKEPEGRTRVLKLPKGDHALLLTLTARSVEQFALDGRGDHENTVRFGLGAAHGIRHENPPKWIGSIG